MEESCYRFITVWIFLLSMVIISGAIWAEQAWGSYWSWGSQGDLVIDHLADIWRLSACQADLWLARPAFFHNSDNRLCCGFIHIFGVNYWLVGLHSYA